MSTETTATSVTVATQSGEGPTAQATSAATSQRFLTNYPSEVRFAVVFYGGVSLAIYINGIVQELLRMVRATATSTDDDQQLNRPLLATAALTGSEQVYRKLSYILAEGSATEVASGQAQLAKVGNMLQADELILTRFVIDTISGTSAGGINGIFLAKALANDQTIDKLEDLWVQEGDIQRMINDRQSVEKPLAGQKSPGSLLNSQRMYLKLLNALDDMDSGAAGNGKNHQVARSPYVDELDLFVTTTDLQGIPLPIRLADRVVYERRHRNVLHFVYSNKADGTDAVVRNDFVATHNPFLAYAARCTSAFPFAFEPMQLTEIDQVLNRLPQYRHADQCKSSSDHWQQFFQDYTMPSAGQNQQFAQRYFGDGGYLDNKPFTYATETLARRYANVPVDRKLIYIEPSPEHPEKEGEREHKPNALENSLAALLQIPRYETIREDLERVMQRNRLIERVNRITKGVEQDIDHAMTQVSPHQELGALDPGRHSTEPWAKPDLNDAEWAKLDLVDMIKRNGKGYVAYHRMEIASVTDDLADLVARVAGYDKASDYCLITRSLVRAWRE